MTVLKISVHNSSTPNIGGLPGNNGFQYGPKGWQLFLFSTMHSTYVDRSHEYVPRMLGRS